MRKARKIKAPQSGISAEIALTQKTIEEKNEKYRAVKREILKLIMKSNTDEERDERNKAELERLQSVFDVFDREYPGTCSSRTEIVSEFLEKSRKAIDKTKSQTLSTDKAYDAYVATLADYNTQRARLIEYANQAKANYQSSITSITSIANFLYEAKFDRSSKDRLIAEYTRYLEHHNKVIEDYENTERAIEDSNDDEIMTADQEDYSSCVSEICSSMKTKCVSPEMSIDMTSLKDKARDLGSKLKSIKLTKPDKDSKKEFEIELDRSRFIEASRFYQYQKTETLKLVPEEQLSLFLKTPAELSDLYKRLLKVQQKIRGDFESNWSKEDTSFKNYKKQQEMNIKRLESKVSKP